MATELVDGPRALLVAKSRQKLHLPSTLAARVVQYIYARRKACNGTYAMIVMTGSMQQSSEPYTRHLAYIW